jgi:hypothetical protein
VGSLLPVARAHRAAHGSLRTELRWRPRLRFLRPSVRAHRRRGRSPRPGGGASGGVHGG